MAAKIMPQQEHNSEAQARSWATMRSNLFKQEGALPTEGGLHCPQRVSDGTGDECHHFFISVPLR